MSGHSKWATTKRAKAVVDAKRSSAFTRLTHLITIAARDKGGDPVTNFSLRLAIEKARAANMPKDKIERAVQKGTGTGADGARLEEILYEGYGPGSVAIIVKTLTDNRNRTVSEVKHLFSKYGGAMGSANSVQWMFDYKGVIELAVKSLTEDQELDLIEAGVEDSETTTDAVYLVCQPESYENLKTHLEKINLPVEDASLTYRAKNPSDVDEETIGKVETLVSALEELDDVVECFTSLN